MKKKFFFFNLETFYYSFCGPFACRPHGALVLRIFHIPRISFRLRGSHYIASRRENMKSRVKPGGRERKKEKEKKNLVAILRHYLHRGWLGTQRAFTLLFYPAFIFFFTAHSFASSLSLFSSLVMWVPPSAHIYIFPSHNHTGIQLYCLYTPTISV